MLHGSKPNIIACTEEDGSRPQTLRQVGIERIVGRQITGWMDHYGSYGMGGPGFFELSLEASARFPREHLVLTLWAAGNWILIDGRWLSAHPNQYAKQRPLFSEFAFGLEQRWDEATRLLVGSEIAEALITDDETILLLVQGQAEHRLEVPKDTSRLPWHGGSLEPHRWNPYESHWDAWVVTQGDLRC